jgi:hypothetical protein
MKDPFSVKVYILVQCGQVSMAAGYEHRMLVFLGTRR